MDLNCTDSRVLALKGGYNGIEQPGIFTDCTNYCGRGQESSTCSPVANIPR